MNCMFRCFALFFLICLPPSVWANYFQQRVNYRIQVTLDDRNKMLHGYLQLTYHNHSPDTLSFIWFHLWPNAYKNDSTALARQFISQKKLSSLKTLQQNRGYLDSLFFTMAGRPLLWSFHPLYEDICKVELPAPLLPGYSIELSTPFRVKLPLSSISRMGYYGDAFYITQWYPKPAVYDSKGWHPMPYLDQGEFYSEFGSFDVEITLPANYVVAATGVLQNAEEQQWLDSLAAVTAIAFLPITSADFPPSSEQLKTIRFVQDSIHDFAWFADKRFHVMQSNIRLPHSGRQVKTAVYFTGPNAWLWKEAVMYIDSALYYYSLWNGDYPYDFCSAVDGLDYWGGMEYPMITIIGRNSNKLSLEDVIVHEVGHNWFYGILASNERAYPWMDEGMNTANELRYFSRHRPDYDRAGSLIYGFDRLPSFIGLHALSLPQLLLFEYLRHARNNSDQPPSLPAEEFTASNYAGMVYAKTALAFEFLRQYLGDATYDSCMHRYFRHWQFRHPAPDDLRQIFQTCTAKDLDWFFNDLISSNKKVDIAIQRVRPLRAENLINPAAQSFAIRLKNRAHVALPVRLSAYKDGEPQTHRWIDGFTGTHRLSFSCARCDEIRVDASLLDLFPHNNRYRLSRTGIQLPRLKLRWLAGVASPSHTDLFVTPLAGWNKYDKWMPGLAVHNISIPVKPFEFSCLPLYSTADKSLAGHLNVSWSIYPSGSIFHQIRLGAEVSRFSYFYQQSTDRTDAYRLRYTALPVFLQLYLPKPHARSHTTSYFQLRNMTTATDDRIYDGLKSYTQTITLHFQQLQFSLTNNRLMDPFSLLTTLENGKRYVKLMTDFRYIFTYRQASRGLHVRWFAGIFLRNKETERNYKFRMSAWNGTQDYLYDHWFLGRSEINGLLSQQMVIQDGGFKSFSYAGQSRQWLTALNLTLDMPGFLPLAFFFDAGMVPSERVGDIKTESFYYDGGISIWLLRHMLEVHIPLFRSSAIRQAQEVNNKKFKDNIRFVFSIRQFGLRSIQKAIL